MAGCGPSWRDAVDGGTRRAARIAARALAGRAQRRHAGDELCAGARSAGAGGRARPGPDFGLCAGARSEEHTSELQSLMRTSYAVFCLKKKKQKTTVIAQK